jgi:hypothetical protein
MHDLLNFGDWQNPLDKSMKQENAQVNLLTKKILGTDDYGIIDFFKEKAKWFGERVKKLGGGEEFQKAEIKIRGNTEIVEIIFKDEKFSDQIVWGRYLDEMKKRFEEHEKGANKRNGAGINKLTKNLNSRT